MRILEKRVRLLSLATVALVSAYFLVGCRAGGGSPDSHGPLGGGAFGSISGGDDCAPGRIGQPQTFGDESFTNSGQATVILDRVVLLHPHHQRLVGSYAVPGTSLIGVPGDWPPKYAGIPASWKYHKPVHGYHLGPGKSFNLVVGVVATAATDVRSAGVLIYYHDSSNNYVLTNHLAMTLAIDKPKGCK